MSHHTVREFTSNDNKLASYVMVVRYEICIGMITGIAMTNIMWRDQFLSVIIIITPFIPHLPYPSIISKKIII